jgi:hypothetical protein
VRFQKTDEGWKPADESRRLPRAIEWSLGCLYPLSIACAVGGGLLVVGLGWWRHIDPRTIILAFLIRYWADILLYAFLVFIAGVTIDYSWTRAAETTFQEALMDSLNNIDARLQAIQAALDAKGTGSDSE